MIAIGIAVAVIVIVNGASGLGDTRPIAGAPGATGGQFAALSIICAVIGVALLARKARR